MDTHDHKNTHPSGHEHHAVHLCHKCGWPFPNPHPSAKHRRAHKRVCGTLEGYKLVDSEEKPHLNPSDDEHDHSDEDHKRPDIPSPKVLERSEKDQGSGGSSTRLNQSEEEVFADASASFSENPGEVSSGVGRISKSDQNAVQVIEASVSDQTIQGISHTSDNGTDQHHDGEENATHPVDHMDHISNSTSTLIGPAHKAPALLNVCVNLSSDSLIVKSESPLDDKSKCSVDEAAEVALAADQNVPHEADVKAIEESNQDGGISGNVVLQREDLRNLDDLQKLEETEKPHASSVTSDEVVLSNKYPGDMLIPEKLAEDFSSGRVSSGQMSLPVESAQIKVDSMQRLESANSVDFVDASDAQLQESENFHVFSVPHDLPVIEQPEDLIKGFKDHKGMRSHQDDNLVQPDTRTLQDRLDTSTTEDDPNVETKIRKENSLISLESPILPVASELKGENNKPMDMEGPLEGEKSSARVSAASAVDQIEPGAVQGLEDEKVEDNKNFHVLSLLHDLPLVEQPENTIKDYKDHKQMKMDQFDNLASCETTVQSEKGNLVDSLDYSISQSKTRKEDAVASADALEITPKAEELMLKPSDEEMLIERAEISGDKDPEHKVDSSVGWDLSNLSDSLNDSNENEEKGKDFHVHSIPDDVGVVDQAENMIKDFKDHEETKVCQLDDLASLGTGSQSKKSNVPVSEDRSVSRPKPEMEATELSPSSKHDSSEDESCKPINSEVPVSRSSLQSVNAILECKDKVPQESSLEKVEKNHAVETHEETKACQLYDLASLGTVSQSEKSNVPVSEDWSVSEPKPEMEATELSPSSKHDNSEDESCKPINSEVPVGGSSLQAVDEILECKDKGPQESSKEKVEKNHAVETHEMEELNDIKTSSLIMETPESAYKMMADACPEVIDMPTEVSETSKTISDNIGINEKAKTDTYNTDAGDHSRSVVEESSLVSGTATESAEKLNDRQVNMTDRSIVDESLCGSEERTGTKTESKDFSLKEETVHKFEGTTHEAKEVGVISVDNSTAHLGSQHGVLATEEGTIKEDEKDRSNRGEKPYILGEAAVAETNASATEEFHANATELGWTPAEHSITLWEGNSTAKQQQQHHHHTSAYIASTEDETNKMVSEDVAPKPTLPTSDTMPSAPTISAAEDQGGNGISRIVPGPDSLMQEESDAAVKQGNGESALDASLDSSGSLEGHWGSVSVLSTQSDTPVVGEAEVLPSNDSRAAQELGKSHKNSGKAEHDVKHMDKSDVFEPPSFMTLVEPKSSDNQNAAASVKKQEHSKSLPVQAGWLPSMPQVSNDSQGRKKNEEIIAKVTNWSTGKQHSPLKNLLVEANCDNKHNPTSPRENSASATQKEENAVKDSGSGVTTVGSILGNDAPGSGAAKKQVGQEWNSPARYPEDIKGEKRKVKGRPYWVQFVCCASAN